MKKLVLLSLVIFGIMIMAISQDQVPVKTKPKSQGIKSGRLTLVEVSEDIMYGRGFGNAVGEQLGSFYVTRIDYTRGRQVGSHFSIGFGTGFNLGYGKYVNPDLYSQDYNEYIVASERSDYFTFSVPAMLDIRIYALKGPISPFVAINGGLEIMYYYNNNYSYFAPLIGFTPKLGCNFTLNGSFGVSVFVGYKGFYSLNSSVRPFSDRYYSGLNAGLGFRF